MNPHELKQLKNKAPLAIILILIAMFLLPYLYVEPQIERENDIASAFDSELSNSIKYLKQSVKYKKNIKQFNKIEKIKNRIITSLPKISLFPKIVDTFQALAQKNNLILQDVKYDWPSRNKKNVVPSFLITFTIKAKYSELRKFLAGLESLKKYPLIIQEIIASRQGTYTILVRQLVKI